MTFRPDHSGLYRKPWCTTAHILLHYTHSSHGTCKATPHTREAANGYKSEVSGPERDKCCTKLERASASMFTKFLKCLPTTIQPYILDVPKSNTPTHTKSDNSFPSLYAWVAILWQEGRVRPPAGSEHMTVSGFSGKEVQRSTTKTYISRTYMTEQRQFWEADLVENFTALYVT